MTKRKVGAVFIIVSIVTLLSDRLFGGTISTLLGKMFCGNRYMQPKNGVVGDVSCGFNADMYLVVFILAVLTIGITLVFKTKDKNSVNKFT